MVFMYMLGYTISVNNRKIQKSSSNNNNNYDNCFVGAVVVTILSLYYTGFQFVYLFLVLNYGIL